VASSFTNLSAIEHVWDEMERRLRHLQNQPMTLVEIGPSLIRIFNILIRSMCRRCQDSINANGDIDATDFVNVQENLCCSKHLPNEFK
jgi:hypothetical protein